MTTISSDPDNAVTTGGKKIKREKSINTTLKKRTSEPMTISSDPDNAVTTGGKKIKREKKVMQTINLESSGFSDCDYLIQKDICFDSETNIFKSVHSNFCFKHKICLFLEMHLTLLMGGNIC